MLLKRSAVLITVFTFIWVILPHIIGHTWDMWAWKDWALYIHEHGLRNIYDFDTDYLPLYHYELWLYGKISGTAHAIETSINTLRLFTLVFETIALWFVYKWTDKKIEFYLLFVLCILNVPYSYNAILWGQMDGTMTMFIFVALYYAYQRKMVLSSLFMLLALNFKLQAIVFVPVWGLLILNNIAIERSVKKVVASVMAIICLQVLILVPFILSGSVWRVWEVATKSVGAYPFLTQGAKNIWTFAFNGMTAGVTDQQVWFAGLTCNKAGLIMFFMASFAILLPFVIRLLRNYRTASGIVVTKVQLWLTCALISMCFYFFNTQMHERYIHPAFIFILSYAIVSKDFIPLAIFAIGYMLNLEDEMGAIGLRESNPALMDDKLIASLYVIVMVYLSVRLFIQYRRKPLDSETGTMSPATAAT